MPTYHNGMDLTQFRYAIALAEEGNFTRAATRCFVVQSALSRQIQKLEKEIGIELFRRTSRRVEVTAAGVAFLESARKSLQAAEDAANNAAAAQGEIRGRLNIGVIPTVTALDVPTAMRVLIKRHPDVRFEFQVAGSDELEEGISSGELDVGLLGLPADRPPRNVAWRRLRCDHLVAVVSREHHLMDRTKVELKDLAEEAFVDFPQGTLAREESDPAFQSANVTRRVICESMATDLTINLVRQNLAVTLLPSKYASRYPDLVSVPITDGPSRVEYLAWNDFNPSPATNAFLEIVDQTAPK